MKARFADVLKIVNGRNQKHVENPNGIYPIYGSGGVIGYADDYICDEHTVVIGRKGSINNPIFVNKKFWNVDTAFGLVANFNIILPKYLYYFCSQYNFNKLSTTVTIPSLTKANLLDIEIEIPSVEEQARIVGILDKIHAVISTQRKLLDLTALLLKSQFIEMFGDLSVNNMGWEVKPFPEFAKIDATMTTEYEKYANHPHIGIDSIESGTGELKGYRTVKQDGIKSGKYLFTPDHIIYSKIRPNLNKVALPAFQGLCSADAYPILNNIDSCDKVFLAYVLRSELFLSYILPLSSRTNFPKANREQITGFSMPLPPLPLQNQFARFVDQADKSKFIMACPLNKVEVDRISLLQIFSTIRDQLCA